MTTLEAIYENGIFKPLARVPHTLKEHERVRITIEADTDENLQAEFTQWEAASDEDFLKFEESEKKNSDAKRSAANIVDTTFGSTHSIKRGDLILLAENDEFSGY